MAYLPKDIYDLETSEKLGLALTPAQKKLRESLDLQVYTRNKQGEVADAIAGDLPDTLEGLSGEEIEQDRRLATQDSAPSVPSLEELADVMETVGSQASNVASSVKRAPPLTQKRAEQPSIATQDTSATIEGSTNRESAQATQSVPNTYPYKTDKYTLTEKPGAIITKGPEINPIHELLKRDIIKKVQESDVDEAQKDAILRTVGGMSASDVYAKYTGGTTGLNDPYINKPRDTTDDKLHQGLINSWNINRAYLGLSPVAQQPNFDKNERDEMRDWVLKRGQLENAQERTEKIGGAKAPANVQLNADIMQQRQLENKLTDLQTNKSKYINDFVRNNKDMPDAAQRAEELYQKAFSNVTSQLTTVRDRIKQQGGRDLGAVSTEAPVSPELAKDADKVRMEEKGLKKSLKEQERKDKLAKEAGERALQLYSSYKSDPRIKDYQETQSVIEMAEGQLAVLEDPKAAPEDRALASDSLLKLFERIQNSGTVLLSEKKDILQGFGGIAGAQSALNKFMGDGSIPTRLVQSFRNAVTRGRGAFERAKKGADIEYGTKGRVLGIDKDVVNGLFGGVAPAEKEEEVVVTEPTPSKHAPVKTAPKAAPKTPAAERKTIGGKVYQKVNGKWEMVK